MEKNKTQEIKNFIGIYDNYITEEECDKAINLFKEQNKFNNTLNRLQFEGSNFLEKKDEQFFARRNFTYRRIPPMAYRTRFRV